MDVAFRKILIFHNQYRWAGGEDSVVDAERNMLIENGHEVISHFVNNNDTLSRGTLATLKALYHSDWSKSSYDLARKLVHEHKPDIVHMHNYWFLLTPSVLAACHDAGVPVVLTLHNMRLACPGGVFMDSGGNPCTLCSNKHPWRGIIKKCYRNSLLASIFVSRMITSNRKRGTWNKYVDTFIVPSRFCAVALKPAGIPAEKIIVKPNFAPDPFTKSDIPEPPKHNRFIYVGRLSREKGIGALLAAWRKVLEKDNSAELVIAGDGPLMPELRKESDTLNIKITGWLEEKHLREKLLESCALILPSECYETFGKVILEAYACKRPVVVSNTGAPPELVEDGKSGLLFTPGDAEEFSACLLKIISDPFAAREMGERGRQMFLEKYTPDTNYPALLECYKAAAANHKKN